MRTFARAAPFAALAFTAGVGLNQAARMPIPGPQDWAVLTALLLPAAVAARLAAGRRAAPTVRLAFGFLLPSLLLLPVPAALVIALLAGLPGRGGGIAGSYATGSGPYAATSLAVLCASALPRSPADDPIALGYFALCFLIIQGLSLLLGRGFDRIEGRESSRIGREELRRWVLESINVPLAWILCGLLMAEAWLPVAALLVTMLFLDRTLQELSRTRREATHAREALASRVGELDTLHAIGREILASLQPERVCRILERECHKIFEFDRFVIAMAEKEAGRVDCLFRHRRGYPAEWSALAVDEPLTAFVAHERRAMRIPDLRIRSKEPWFTSPLLDSDSRSALVVPLIVEDRVTGVLTVQSRRTRAYDEHQLTVLTTIAQQAAVALENARHYQLATVDSLTGFFLRDYFFRRLGDEYQRVSRYGGQFSLLMLDLDGFKAINDRHGHPAGDQYLRDVSDTIRAELRAADLGCRYGGDEFCLMLPETDPAGARVIAERIREAIGAKIVGAQGLAVRATASIGIASYPDHDGGDVAALLRNADEALYRAKRAGRDCVVPFAA